MAEQTSAERFGEIKARRATGPIDDRERMSIGVEDIDWLTSEVAALRQRIAELEGR